MQLDAPSPTRPLRHRLRSAACLLLASGACAGKATAQSANTQLDTSTLFYTERGRTTVVEPMVRLTRSLSDGQSFSAQLVLDAMTGASPTGATPSKIAQTVTSASGSTSTTEALKVPVSPFRDFRGALDFDWVRPLGLVTPTTSAHVSRERDYRSLGASEVVSIDLMQRLTTLTVGGGYNSDEVTPIGGTPIGLSDGSVRTQGSNSKRVASGTIGLSRVLTRRWLVGVTGTRIAERGYLTEPYKVVSLLDSVGTPSDQLTEKRPESRSRSGIEASSAYHLDQDVVYTTYRYYWDDWGIRSHTLDFKYRHELGSTTYFTPHVRLYAQTQADFFSGGLQQGVPLPTFASADYRLGPLRSGTLGGTFGFHLPKSPGELTLRVEYIHQWGKGDRGDGETGDVEGPSDDHRSSVSSTVTHPTVAPVDIGTVVLGYSVGF